MDHSTSSFFASGRDMLLKHLPDLSDTRRLKTLVEHRSVYALDAYELNLFETYVPAERFALRFNDLVITAMLRGKKVMHLPERASFDYLPGESVLVKPGELMHIDFPDAQPDNPTHCLALAVPKERIQRTLDWLNDRWRKLEEQSEWHLSEEHFHLINSHEIADNLRRIIEIAQANRQEKDLLADLALQELIVRLMQTQARKVFFEQFHQHASSHRLAFVLQYIHDHLTEKLDVKTLSQQACMSPPHFFRVFKQEFGISPIDYILRERIELAKSLLRQTEKSLQEVAFLTGFQSFSNFYTLFKKHTTYTPGNYRKNIG